MTSREPLRVASEQQFEVAPLATPDLLHLPALEAFSQVEAVALFVERTRALRSGWELTSDNAGAVAEICVQLDGLPLAIELAASWMNVLSPQAMVSELPHALRLLGHGVLPGRRAIRHCRPLLTGATTCSRTTSGDYFVGWPCLTTAGHWTGAARCAANRDMIAHRC